MALFLTDKDIATLLAESKPLPADWRTRAVLKPKRGHREREFDVKGESGSQFRMILRQAVWNPFDFSVILGLLVPKTNQVFRVLRCNGKSHEHTNRIEGESFLQLPHPPGNRAVSEGGLP